MFVHVVYLMVCFVYSNVIEQLIYFWLIFCLGTKQANDGATSAHHYSSSFRVYWIFFIVNIICFAFNYYELFFRIYTVDVLYYTIVHPRKYLPT